MKTKKLKSIKKFKTKSSKRTYQMMGKIARIMMRRKRSCQLGGNLG